MTGQGSRDRQGIAAGLGRASGSSEPGARALAPTNSDGQTEDDVQSVLAVGEGPAIVEPPPSLAASVPHPFPHPDGDIGARAAIPVPEPVGSTPRATSSGPSSGAGESEAISASTPTDPTPRSHFNPDGQRMRDTHGVPAVGEGEGGREAALDPRFTDPLVQEIVETWRLRQDFLRAHTRLTLQIRAICRRLCAGDKAEADRVYASMLKDREHPLAATAWLATMPLVSAREPIEDGRKRLEKQLAKLAQKLPTAPFAAATRGFGFASLAATYGECGDVAAYRTVAGLWKRAGLAVIDGERQRKVAGDAALLHGYSPSRRSVFWNIAALQIKTNGKYRPLYDERKEYRLAQGWTKGHAHNDAGRYITKRLLRDLWIAAREARS